MHGRGIGESTVRVCPSCARIYDSETTLCPVDGVFLQLSQDPRTGMRVGNYLLMGPLGEGGMGHVYRAEHVLIQKEVAIKVLRLHLAQDKQLAQRFLMEARAASMVRHSAIVDVTDFGELPDGCAFIVMEFVDGPNLAKEIAQQERLPLYRAVNILNQVCQALIVCHDKGIAHRDLKPENIVLLRREGRRDLITVPRSPEAEPAVRRERFYDEVKILDFGIAKIQQLTAQLDEETKSRGMVFGSPYYLSPEQAQGEPGDHRSDIYALGIIFYEMLTGEVPFNGDTTQEIMRQHIYERVPSMRARWPDLEIPPEADQLVSRATAKAMRDRHRSVADFLNELRHCFGKEIYGRDIDRYLKVRRRSTIQHFPAAPPVEGLERRLTPRQVQINAELEGLFNQSYEAESRATPSTINEIRAVQSRHATRRDSKAVRAELDGLFDPKE